MTAFEQLKESNSEGRFWLKLDATDLKEGLMESCKGVWNGDEDLGNGKLQELRMVYKGRVTMVTALPDIRDRDSLEMELRKCIDSF